MLSFSRRQKCHDEKMRRRRSTSYMTMVVSFLVVFLFLFGSITCHDTHYRHHHPPSPQYKHQQQQQQPSSQQKSESLNTNISNNNNNNPIRIVPGPGGAGSTRAVKYCADLSPLREFLNTQIEPYYTPLISLLPENVQLVLLDESSFGGFTTASCALVMSGLLVALVFWFSVVRYMQTNAENTSARLNEQLLALKLTLNQAYLKSSTFEHEIGILEVSCAF